MNNFFIFKFKIHIKSFSYYNYTKILQLLLFIKKNTLTLLLILSLIINLFLNLYPMFK